jgi:Uri superfamily endonuclease
MANSGLYQLRIRLRQKTSLQIGALGKCHLRPGWYVYTGSARRGLRQRVSRHLRSAKRYHWHVDYLLAIADKVEAFVTINPSFGECQLHGSLHGGSVEVPGFGSSDCKCLSHLSYFTKKPAIKLTPWSHFQSTNLKQGPINNKISGVYGA